MPESNAFNPTQKPANADSPKTLGLYDTANPQFALQNALIDQGYNPFAANPFTQRVLRAAPGLAYGFTQSAAGQNLGPEAEFMRGSMFQDYLKNAIGGSGGVLGALSGAWGGVNDSLRGARDFGTGVAQGNINPLTANPFMAELSAMLSAGGGSGAIEALANLLSPALNRSSANAIGSLFQGALGGAARKLPDSGLTETGSDNDIFKFLFGI